MGIDDHIRLHPALGERHVDHRPLLRTDALLPMSRGELVADDGRTGDPEGDVYLLKLGVPCVRAYTEAFTL